MSPSRSRTSVANCPERAWAIRGLTATASRKGESTNASGQAITASTASTPAGTTTATKAGVMVWAKKYSTVSMSLPTILTRSPERRFTIYARSQGVQLAVHVDSHLVQQTVGHVVGLPRFCPSEETHQGNKDAKKH